MTERNFDDVLTQYGLTEYYLKTSDIFKNFWTTFHVLYELEKEHLIVGLIKDANSTINTEIISFLNRINNLSEKVEVLSNIDKINEKLMHYQNVSFVLIKYLNDDNKEIFYLKNILEVLDSFEQSFLLAFLGVEGVEQLLTTLNTSLQSAKVSREKIVVFLKTLFFKESKICVRFIQFLTKLSLFELARFVNIYSQYDGFLVHTIEQNTQGDELLEQVHLRFMFHHNLAQRGVDYQEAARYLLDVLHGKHLPLAERVIWKRKVIPSFFHALNKNVLELVDALKIIEIFSYKDGQKYYQDILVGLLNLLYLDETFGLQKVKLLLDHFIRLDDQVFISPFLEILKNFSRENISLVFEKLIIKQKIAENFINYAINHSGKAETILRAILDSKENLFIVLEEVNQFDLFFDDATGYFYVDLVNELKLLNTNLLRVWISMLREDAYLLENLKFLSSTNQTPEGFPYLISGLLTLGELEVPSEEPSFENIKKFLGNILEEAGDEKTLNNLGRAINVIGSRIAVRKLIAFIHNKQNFINNISFEGDVDSFEKTKIILKLVCHKETTLMKKLVNHFLSLDVETVQSNLKYLFYKDQQNNIHITEGFFKALEVVSSSNEMLEDIESFKCAKEDPYIFVRMLERICGHDLAYEKFQLWLKESRESRQKFLAKMCVMEGEDLHSFVSKFALQTDVGDLFGYLSSIKKQSNKIYEGLLAIFTKIPNEAFKDLQPIISNRVSSILGSGDVLEALSSSGISYDKVKYFIKKLNVKFITALHEAFDGEDDLELTLKFIQHIYDKDFVIDALNQLTIQEAKSLINAFMQDESFMHQSLESINNLGFEGKVKDIIHSLVVINDTFVPKDKKQGVGPDPVFVCHNVLGCLKHIQDSGTIGFLSNRSLVLSFEKAMRSIQQELDFETVQKAAVDLLKQKTFLHIVSYSKSKQSLIEGMIRRPHLQGLEPELLMHLVLYDGNFEHVESIINKIDLKLKKSLNHYFINNMQDPLCKLLGGVLQALYQNESQDPYKNVLLFGEILESKLNLRESLFRFANWANITSKNLKDLISWLMKDGRMIRDGEINYEFHFPSFEGCVVQDDLISKWCIQASPDSSEFISGIQG